MAWLLRLLKYLLFSVAGERQDSRKVFRGLCLFVSFGDRIIQPRLASNSSWSRRMTLTVCSSHQQPPKCWGCSLGSMMLCGAGDRLQYLTDGRKALRQVKHIAGPVGLLCSLFYPPCLKLTPAKDSLEIHICRTNTKKGKKKKKVRFLPLPSQL